MNTLINRHVFLWLRISCLRTHQTDFTNLQPIILWCSYTLFLYPRSVPLIRSSPHTRPQDRSTVKLIREYQDWTSTNESLSVGRDRDAEVWTWLIILFLLDNKCLVSKGVSFCCLNLIKCKSTWLRRILISPKSKKICIQLTLWKEICTFFIRNPQSRSYKCKKLKADFEGEPTTLLWYFKFILSSTNQLFLFSRLWRE